MEVPNIGGWSVAELRRYIINLLLSDPAALPKSVSSPSQQLPSGANDGEVPIWNAATNSWVTTGTKKEAYSQLNLLSSINNADFDSRTPYQLLMYEIDNRNAATAPNDYNAAARLRFRTLTALGLTSSGTFASVIGYRAWSDSSGGQAVEMAFTDAGDVFHRHGSTTTWNAWQKLLDSGEVVNADISASAAIAYSKLNLANSIVSGDIVDGTLVNADINASAAIAESKLAFTHYLLNRVVWLTSGTSFVATAGTRALLIECVGGGGGGGGAAATAAAQSSAGGGGGGGGYGMKWLTSNIGTHTYAIGAGGAANSGAAGGAGGNTSFQNTAAAVVCQGNGGSGGGLGAVFGAAGFSGGGGNGGSASGTGDLTLAGMSGYVGFVLVAGTQQRGGFGGAPAGINSAGGIDIGGSGAGGGGGIGGGGSGAVNGASQAARAGGAGGAGFIRIWEFF